MIVTLHNNLSIGRQGSMRNTMRRIILFLVFALITISASAQDKPKAADKPIETNVAKEAPAEATIPAEEVKKLQAAADAAKMARLEAENLALQIERAQGQLKQLQEAFEKARDESNAAFNRAAIKAGIPGAEVTNYEGKLQADGSLKLTKRPAPLK